LFILIVALALGIIAGYSLGGRLRNLEHLQLRLSWLVVLALAVQLAIFSPLGSRLDETVAVMLHLASYALILTFAAANWRKTGVLIAGIGAGLNAAVITANGGFMPATERALRFAGLAVEAEPHNNSALAGEGARLLPLGDVMAIPDWVPLVANVFSIGDVLIATGVAVMLAVAMRDPAQGRSAAPDRAGEPRRRGGIEPVAGVAYEPAAGRHGQLATIEARLDAFCAAAVADGSDKALGAAMALVEACEELVFEQMDDPSPRSVAPRSTGPRRAAALHVTDGEPEAP
jgi:hypothetical protein